MTPQEFIAKWQRVNLSERSACQQHFLDLCELLNQPKPAAADPEGEHYTFERGVHKTDGGQGWADVWMRGHFGWEYKGKHKDLVAAYKQLLLYREDLENPPLLVVCDLDRFEVHTNFTDTIKKVHAFNLAGLADPANLDVLKKLFTDPHALKPGETRETITEEASKRFGILAESLRNRGEQDQRVAHFLMKLMFCMFAEDIGLLPAKLFSKLIEGTAPHPAKLVQRLKALFTAMCKGGDYGNDEIPWFNGGLFADADVIDLQSGDVAQLYQAATSDWSCVEPSIFGTLFERIMDPSKHALIGAHYTSRKDIETLLEPVMMAPLRREWDKVRARCDKLWPKVHEAAKSSVLPPIRPGGKARKESKPRRDHDQLLIDFVQRLVHVTVLDPACGSGNFLYVALHLLLNLEKQVLAYGAQHRTSVTPHVSPKQFKGIEINRYAQELAQVVLWIGHLQWKIQNGYQPKSHPVLDPIDNIQCKDAILDLSDPKLPGEPQWPEAEFIVGNPPFLGTKKLRGELSDEYVEKLFAMFSDRIPPFSDLCCYWFEKARAQIEVGQCRRAGLLATQGIRGGLNREVLNRIKQSGDIFFAESDRDWILDGANVHVSMIGFDNGEESASVLDGKQVSVINANLTTAADTTQARRLLENKAIGFIADVKAGKFDIALEDAIRMLRAPNPNGKPTSDVLRPWANGRDVVQRYRDVWIIDFGSEMPLQDAASYEQPFQLVEQLVKPERDKVKRRSYREYWWIHAEPCAEMRRKIEILDRYCVTTTVSKHRVFAWMSGATLPDHQLVAFARSDDYFFGVLHSRIHEVWARAQGTQVRERESGFRYTPTTCFETFPFPKPTPAQREAIAAAAKELDGLRQNWLNPPEWTREEVLEFPGSVDGPWRRYATPPPNPLSPKRRGGNGGEGVGMVRYPRLVAKDADCGELLAKRTLTNLYNERPTWLDLAHKKLAAAVFAAYGWKPNMSDDELLAALLALNLERAKAEAAQAK